ncbi:ECF subfamily RNA polymerase sigma-24 subunit [Thermincola ferriacetica]|uniref:RNA polymerase sigma factor n=1 Tax=Thermincola ferriacetica TaxID=281456 RepID=A0A0L6W246_9FIRM|nr:sigma-70 family RNA polymerase sigma factor [Thermincola ferriacetica]KNZ69154.1 ECF subfamily RNA polymerase sigma-24 subunit [Thermincola ferriacetica]
MEISDVELIQKCKQGSKGAFEQVVKNYQQYAFKIAYGIVGHDRDAEDIVQEAFITVYYQIKSLRRAEAFPTWLGRIITNFCLKKIQANNKKAIVPLDACEGREMSGLSSEDEYLALETKQDVHKALLKLPVEYRVTLVLRDLQGYSYKEIAEILNIPTGTVKSRIHQARTMLAGLLQPPAGEGGNKR